MKQRRRKALFGVMAIVCSIGISLAIAEGALRLLGFEYNYDLKIEHTGEEWRDYLMFEEQMFEPDPILLWRPRNSDDDYVPFNSYGYRGREVDRTKGDDELRVLAVGDSNTLGPAGYSWPGFLQEVLDSSCPNIVPTVLNAGVYGYSSFQGVRRFEEGLQFAPDVVLVSFGWNDAITTTNLPDKYYGERALRFSSIKRFLARKSRIYHLVRAASDRLLGESLLTAETSGIAPRVTEADYRSNLTSIVTASLERGILPILLTRPNVVNLDSEFAPVLAWRLNLTNYNKIVGEVARQFEIPLVDAYEIFAGLPQQFLDENHLTESAAGHLAGRVYSEINANFDDCAEYTAPGETSRRAGSAPAADVTYVDSDSIRLRIEPLDVVAGRDSYWLWLEGIESGNSAVTIEYRLNGGRVERFQAELDADGRTRYYVSPLTRKGVYEFVAFQPSDYDSFVRSDVNLRVR